MIDGELLCQNTYTQSDGQTVEMKISHRNSKLRQMMDYLYIDGQEVQGIESLY